MSVANPFFSVILPTYNRAKFIGSAIESVLYQSYENWELIVVNDYSTDTTINIIEGYACERIKVLNLEKNHGVSYARNRALDIADGEFVTFLDDDDLYAPSFLQAIYEQCILDDQSYDFYWTGVGFFEDVASINIKIKSKLVCKADSKIKDEKELLLKKIAISHGVAIKKQSLLSVGHFDEDFVSSEDKDLFLRMVKYGLSYKAIASVQVYRREHDSPQLSHNSDNAIRVKSAERMVIKHKDYLSENKKLYFALNGSLARKYFRAGQLDKGRSLMKNLYKESKSVRILLKWAKLEIKY